MHTVNCPQIFAAVFLLARFVLVQATVMFGSGHPNDTVTVGPNVRVNFSCTVNCSYPVDWYKAGHWYPIKTEYNDSRSIPGLQFRISNSTCTSEFKTTYFLEVLARRKFHKSVFYCAAYESCSSCLSTECKCGCGGMCYSRPWFLRVNKMDAAVTTTLHLHPTPSSSQPLQETMPPEATTKTITVIPTPTNCPTSAAAADSTSLQVETSSSQAASAPAAILAGLGIVASILHL